MENTYFCIKLEFKVQPKGSQRTNIKKMLRESNPKIKHILKNYHYVFNFIPFKITSKFHHEKHHLIQVYKYPKENI